MGKNIVMPRTARASPKSAVAVFALFVDRVVKTFGDQAPLNGQIRCFVNGKRFVGAPTYRTVIDDHLLIAFGAEAVVLNARRISGPKTHVANNGVVRLELHAMIANTNSISGRRLTSDRDKRILDFNLRLKWNCAGHPKNDNPRSLRIASGAKTAGAAII